MKLENQLFLYALYICVNVVCISVLFRIYKSVLRFLLSYYYGDKNHGIKPLCSILFLSLRSPEVIYFGENLCVISWIWLILNMGDNGLFISCCLTRFQLQQVPSLLYLRFFLFYFCFFLICLMSI